MNECAAFLFILIQVIFSMMVELIKFLFVLFVVMLGFTMSFKALFRSNTYGETWLHLFEAMLGELGFFEDFPDDRFDFVATVLFVVYLVVTQIMLLNLLIAILSISHARVQENAEREFKVSKALLIKHYRMVVDKDILPAPFNLVQLIVSGLCMLLAWGGKTYGGTKRVVGQVVFQLVMGPPSIACGAILWIFSVWHAPIVWRSHYHRILKHNPSQITSTRSLTTRYFTICAWCVLGAPLCLLILWLREPMMRIRRVYTATGREPKSSSRTDVDVNDLLRSSPGALSADDLQKYLSDPMSDPEVRQDETKTNTTVEHIKQLRDHFDKKADERFKLLEASINNTQVMVRDHLERKPEEGFKLIMEAFVNETKAVVAAMDRRLDNLVSRAEGAAMNQLAGHS